MVLSKPLDGTSDFKEEPYINGQEDLHRPERHIREIHAIRLIEIDCKTLSKRQKMLKNEYEKSAEGEEWMMGICVDEDSNDPFEMHWNEIGER